jgi:ribosomal protein L37E
LSGVGTCRIRSPIRTTLYDLVEFSYFTVVSCLASGVHLMTTPSTTPHRPGRLASGVGGVKPTLLTPASVECGRRSYADPFDDASSPGTPSVRRRWYQADALSPGACLMPTPLTTPHRPGRLASGVGGVKPTLLTPASVECGRRSYADPFDDASSPGTPSVRRRWYQADAFSPGACLMPTPLTTPHRPGRLALGVGGIRPTP